MIMIFKESIAMLSLNGTKSPFEDILEFLDNQRNLNLNLFHPSSHPTFNKVEDNFGLSNNRIPTPNSMINKIRQSKDACKNKYFCYMDLQEQEKQPQFVRSQLKLLKEVLKSQHVDPPTFQLITLSKVYQEESTAFEQAIQLE